MNDLLLDRCLIDASVELDWPKDKMEIQILDDSTDDTREIVNERVDYWSKKGISVKVLRRGNREGFKAGALSCGLLKAMNLLRYLMLISFPLVTFCSGRYHIFLIPKPEWSRHAGVFSIRITHGLQGSIPSFPPTPISEYRALGQVQTRVVL